jgi:tRNA dimethylallyltransferase
MIESGLVEEIYSLEKRYTRKPNPMKAIGIKETLEYLDGKYDLAELYKRIVDHTMQLAKRQRTFIKSQLPQSINIEPEDVERVVRALKPA